MWVRNRARAGILIGFALKLLLSTAVPGQSQTAPPMGEQAYVQINRLRQGKLKFGRFEYFDGTGVKPKDPTLATLVHQSLANVWDLSGDYQVTRDFSLGLYYAHAWGKGVIESIYPKDPNGQFAFIETNLHF